MPENEVEYRFKLRRALAATWVTLNDVLLDGELGWERDTGKIKTGNGVDPWTIRDYIDRAIDLRLLGDVNADEIGDGRTLIWDDVAGKHRYVDITSIVGSNVLLQRVSKSINGVYSTTDTSLPSDNTIPQITEGSALADFDIAISPKSITSKLVIKLGMPVISSSTGPVGIRFAVFRDSDSDAIGASFQTVPANNYGVSHVLVCEVNSASIAETTFTFRWGTSTGTAYLNRTSSAAAFFGGELACNVSIEEFEQ